MIGEHKFQKGTLQNKTEMRKAQNLQIPGGVWNYVRFVDPNTSFLYSSCFLNMNYLYRLPKLPCLIYLFFWFLPITQLTGCFLRSRQYIYLQGLSFALCPFHLLSSIAPTLKQHTLNTEEESGELTRSSLE